MLDNDDAPDASGRIRVGNVPGTMIVGSRNTVNNLEITAEYGSSVTVHAGPLPNPVKRRPISQLPRSDADLLIGREQDVQVLREAIEAHQLVQVWGAPGVGKSTLLRHLALTVPRGPEGAAYIEAAGRSADDIAQAIFDISFDAPNYKPSPEVLKEHLKALELRIYLDDAGLDDKDLRRLFDLAERSAFVFTAQRRSTVGAAHAIRLEGLTAPAATRLVETLLGRDMQPGETPTVEALCDAVDGNPLQLRRIASSAATGEGLPGIADLPALLPALVKRLTPQEHDLLHLLGSLSGAELAERHLKDLLGDPEADHDAGALADGLVRRGLLLASGTGYSCPPDVAEYVLRSRTTDYPADRLCHALTAWVEATDTTPDDVATYFQVLDIAVLLAEEGGHAALGVALARAASPKLALSRQFDAWGSLLGAGWAAAKSAEDEAGEHFFLREARARRKAIGRAALTTVLAVEAEVLWREVTLLRRHSTAQHVVNAATSTVKPIHTFSPPHSAGHPPTLPHPPVLTPGTSAPVHPPVAKPVADFSRLAGQPHAAASVSGTNPTVQIPRRIDLAQSHAPAAQAAHAVPANAATTTTTASGGHTAVAAGTATAKGGFSALAMACTLGFVAVVGVGAAVYASDQSNPSPVITPNPAGASSPIGGATQGGDASPTVDPVCASVLSALPPEIQQVNTDAGTAAEAVEAYNDAMSDYNSGGTSTVPDDSTVLSDVDTVVSDLDSVESTLQQALSEAQDGSVIADLNGMLTPAQEMVSLYQTYESDPQDDQFDASSESSAMNSASDSLQTDCGD